MYILSFPLDFTFINMLECDAQEQELFKCYNQPQYSLVQPKCFFCWFEYVLVKPQDVFLCQLSQTWGFVGRWAFTFNWCILVLLIFPARSHVRIVYCINWVNPACMIIYPDIRGIVHLDHATTAAFLEIQQLLKKLLIDCSFPFLQEQRITFLSDFIF